MNHEEKALKYFKENFYCSQAVLASYADEIGLTKEQCFKIATCFNSGMRKGEMCGACSGALMVLGMILSESQENYDKANSATSEFLEEFKKENGSYICKELLNCDISNSAGIKYAVENNLFIESCPKFVSSSVKILEKVKKKY